MPKEKEPLSDAEKAKKAEEILPLLKEMAINDALEVLDFTKGYLLDFMTWEYPSSTEQKS